MEGNKNSDFNNPNFRPESCPDTIKIEVNDGNERPNDNPFMSLREIAHAVVSISQQPTPTGSVAPISGIRMSNGMEVVSPANQNISAYPYNSLYPVFNVDDIVPMFNHLEPLIINRAVLTPPPPGERRTRRTKPPGCRTVFVGNMPEKITEDIIREAFKICGPIAVIRMSRKKFCHIRFLNMESVDQALLLSGFRIRIDENEEYTYNGTLHVDYANAHDDHHDYECLEKARLREEHHRQLQAFLAPSRIPYFSEHGAQTLAANFSFDKLHKEETFTEGVRELITWLDRGQSNEGDLDSFYSRIQQSHSRVKRLRNEQSRYKEEAEKANENLMNKNRAIELEIYEIEKLFVAAKTQEVRDHLTRSQLKKMEEMKSDTYDIKQTNSEYLVDQRVEDEMELSDTEDRNDYEDGNMFQEDVAEEKTVLREEIRSLYEKLVTAFRKMEGLVANCAKHHN